MKKFIIGFIIGLMLGGGVAWAVNRCSLVDGHGVELGTSANPIHVTGI